MTPFLRGLRARLRACRGVLVDSNILLDIATDDAAWGDWSAQALAEIAEHSILIVNPIIYAEVSVGYSTIEALDASLPAELFHREALPWEAGFLAGKCFLLYRRGRLAEVASARFLHRRARGGQWHRLAHP